MTAILLLSNNGKVQATYMGSPISTNGIIATTDFYTPMSVTSIFNEISYNATIRNSNNNNIDPNSITMTSVLMGDVNQDGVVDTTDVRELNNYLMSDIQFPLSEKAILAANVINDYDNDGNPKIESKDAFAITKVLSWRYRTFLIIKTLEKSILIIKISF